MYWGAKQVDGDRLDGSTFDSGAEALRRYGQPAEAYWPYEVDRDSTDGSYAPPADALRPENCFRCMLLQIRPDVHEIKRQLVQQAAVALGILMSETLYLPSAGDIAMPSRGQVIEDGHAVVAVGYDDCMGTPSGRFIVRNSWGPRWGDCGYGYLPYEYVEKLCAEAWVVGSLPI